MFTRKQSGGGSGRAGGREGQGGEGRARNGTHAGTPAIDGAMYYSLSLSLSLSLSMLLVSFYTSTRVTRPNPASGASAFVTTALVAPCM